MTEHIPTPKDLEETKDSFIFRYVDLELEEIVEPVIEEPEEVV